MAERFPSDDTARVVVRCGTDLRDRLNALAKANGRSSNAEAVQALWTWVGQAKWVADATEGKDPGPWPGARPDPYPEDLRTRLLDAARANGRTSDAEAIARLEASFSEAPSLFDVMRATAPDVLKMLDDIKSAVGRLGGDIDEIEGKTAAARGRQDRPAND